jgi:hypothetical protein
MIYRKGELSKGTIDRDWPHQVALPAARCGGANYVSMRLFCEEEKLSLCVRGHPTVIGKALHLLPLKPPDLRHKIP